MQATPLNAFLEQLDQAFLDGDPQAPAKQAEAENVRTLRQQYEAIAAGDFAAAINLLAEDVELEIVGPPDFPFAGRWRGREDVRAALTRNFALVAQQQPRIDSLTAQGDTVVVVARESGRYVPTGQTYDVHWVQVMRFRDGRIARVQEIADSAAFLKVVRTDQG
jgi:ketosteroid isomerase-like protein